MPNRCAHRAGHRQRLTLDQPATPPSIGAGIVGNHGRHRKSTNATRSTETKDSGLGDTFDLTARGTTSN